MLTGHGPWSRDLPAVLERLFRGGWREASLGRKASARAGLLADRDFRGPSGAWTGLHPDDGGAGRDGEAAPSDDLQGTLEEEAAAPGRAPAHVLRERRLALVNRVEAN